MKPILSPQTSLFLACVLFLAGHVHATKLFAVDVSYNGGANSIRAENSSLPKLVDDLLKNQGIFSALDGEDLYDAAVTYFGFPDALRLSIDESDPDIFKLTLTSSLTGLAQEFEATSEDDLKKQLTRWLYLKGNEDAAELLQALINASAAVITDGSPASTTARMSDSTFRMFGMYPGTGTNDTRGAGSGAHFAVWFDTDSYTLTSPAGDIDGTRSRITAPLWLHFSKRVSLVALLELDFNSLEGTQFYGVGGDIGVAFRPIVRSGEKRFGWQITPYVGAYGTGSIDGVTAAILSQVGAINRLEWRLGKRSLISFATQITTFDNLVIDLGDIELSTPVDQEILKNGLLYEFPLFSLKRFRGNLQFIDTRFLKESRVDYYQTYAAGLSYRLQTFSLQTSLGYDYSDLYSGVNWALGLNWDL